MPVIKSPWHVYNEDVKLVRRVAKLMKISASEFVRQAVREKAKQHEPPSNQS